MVSDFVYSANESRAEMGIFKRFFGALESKAEGNSAEFEFLKIPGGESLGDARLLSGICETFEGKLPVVGANFLVAYENLFLVRTIFDRGFRDCKECPTTTENFVRFLAYERSKCTSSSIQDETNNRRFSYFYVAALLKIAQSRAEVRPVLWEKIADVWILLLPGARALRRTLDSTQLWSRDEMQFFAKVKTESEGENYCLRQIAPPEVQNHKKIDDYLWKDTRPEVRAEIESTIERDMKRWRGESN